MKMISIKTVDGSRFDIEIDPNLQKTVEDMIQEAGDRYVSFFKFPVDGGNKYFNIQNIVSITEKEIEE